MPVRMSWRTGVAVLALVLTACGGDGAGEAAGGATGPTAENGAVETIPVEAFEYEFVLVLERPLAPVTYEPGAATFVFENIGEEEHEFVLMRLEEGRTFADILSYIEDADNQGAPPDLVTIVGNTFAEPGETSEPLTVDMSSGTYVMACFVQTDDGVPHAALGMVESFTVE